MTSAFLAFLHHAAAFVLFGALMTELVLTRGDLNLATARSLLRMDAAYGISALLVLVVGFLRVFYTEKGAEYYFGSGPFIAKVALFAVAGVLSIVSRAAAEARGQQVDEEADAALRAAVEAQIEAESLPMFLSGRLYDDGVIDPRDTRTVLGMCLSAIANGPIEGTSNFGVFRM